MIRLGYGVALAALVPLLAWNGFTQQMNAACYDLMVRLRGPAVDSRVALLAIDDQTAARYGPLPLDRGLLAQALEAVAVARPRTLAVDLLLAGERPEDGRLARALARFPRVVLGAAIEAGEGAEWILPAPRLRDAGALGHVHAAPDPDGVVRSVLLAKAAAGRRLWALAFETVYGAERPVEARAFLTAGGARIPAEADERRMWINFAGPEGAFERISLGSVLDGSADISRFRGKTVIVGVTAQGGGDRMFTPVSSGLGMSGVEVHANIVRTLADQAFLAPVAPAVEMAAYVFLCVAFLWAAVRLRGAALLLALAAGCAVLVVFCGLALRMGSIWPLASMLAVFAAASAIGGAGEYALAVAAWRESEARRRESAFRVQAIAHEIGTPLTAIQGSSELIAGETVPAGERAEIAGLIHKESKRLAEIVRAFLSVERISAGTLALEKQPVALDALCAEVLERARLYASRKQIQIEARTPAVTVQADPGLLSLAVYNLLTNAVKYSPKRSTVHVAIEDGPRVRISVADEGCGIAAGEQRRIFERFYRAPGAAEEGAGIGLALVKEIVAQHGGEVQVKSRPGAGSRFAIVLPKGNG